MAAGASSTLTLTADYAAVPVVMTAITVKGTSASDQETTTFNLAIEDIVFRAGFEVTGPSTGRDRSVCTAMIFGYPVDFSVTRMYRNRRKATVLYPLYAPRSS